VKVTGNKGGFCVTSAISPAGRMLFRIEKETVSAKVHIEFLGQTMRHHPNRKIILVEDHAPPHTANAVDEFVKDHRKRFAIYYLPPYSPHLNPDEEVWNHLKNHKLKAHQVRAKKEFKPFVLGKMRSIQMRPDLVKSFFYKYNRL
jgi:transposase